MPSQPKMIARITPTIYLDQITIQLQETTPFPTVELRGRVRTGDRKRDQASDVTIKTTVLTDEGRTFIAQMLDAYAGVTPEQKR